MDNLKRLDQRVKIDENGFPLQRENSFHIITTVVNFVPPTSNYHSSISLDRTIAGWNTKNLNLEYRSLDVIFLKNLFHLYFNWI